MKPIFFKQRSVLIGDDHSAEFWSHNFKNLIAFKPDFLLLEVIGKHRFLTKQSRTSAKKSDIYLSDSTKSGYNSDAFKLADQLNIPMIGIDVWDKPYVFPKEWDVKDRKTNFEYSHKIREKNMLSVFKEFESKGKILLIVGNEHLRKESVLYQYSSLNNHIIKHFIM